MSEVLAMASAYETALERLEGGVDGERVIPSEEMESVREDIQDWEHGTPPENVRHIIAFNRATAIVRTILSTVAFTEIGEFSEEQYSSIQGVYRFVTGPLLEVEHRLRDDTDSELDMAILNQLRRQTQQIQSQAAETELLPPDDSALPSTK